MRISWDEIRNLPRGLSNGVLYPQNSLGVPWNGLISVSAKGDGSSSSVFIDGQKVRNRISPGVFSGTISAYSYPDEFEPCIGLDSGISNQRKQYFGLSFRTSTELHIVYNAVVAPSA